MNRRYAVMALALVILISGSTNRCPGGGEEGSCDTVVFDTWSGTQEGEPPILPGVPVNPPFDVTLVWATSGWSGDVTYTIHGIQQGGDTSAGVPLDEFIDSVGSHTWSYNTDSGLGIVYESYRIAVVCGGTESVSVLVYPETL